MAHPHSAADHPAAGSPHSRGQAHESWPEVADRTDQTVEAGTRIAADDMEDDLAEIRLWFPGQSTEKLEALLAAVRAPLVASRGEQWSLLRSYQVWDAAALRQQRNYVRLVRASGCFAVLAVMLAIFQLPQAEWERIGVGEWSIFQGIMTLLNLHDVHAMFELAETLTAVLALAAVTVGIVSALSHLWQQRRLQAEQCRFLKFGYLLRCATSAEAAHGFLSEGLHVLHALDDKTLRAKTSLATLDPALKLTPRTVSKLWIRRDVQLVEVTEAPTENPNAELTPLIVEYFVRKRIRYQARYFQRQAHRRERNEKLSKWLPVLLFFLSLVFAMAHFAVPTIGKWFWPGSEGGGAAVEHPTHAHSVFALICLLCAAGLPAVGAWIRTYRGALEFARNANRFHGMWMQLHEFERELSVERQAGNLRRQLQILQNVEIALETEHRSWTRLMIEAEWYG